MKTLTVEIKNHFGNERIYPVSDEAKLLARLVGSKTFTRESIALAKELGFSFQVKQEEI